MDIQFFLVRRTTFIKHYFDEASFPFLDTMRKIEAEESPFETPDWDESMSTEQPFVEEWVQAQTGLEVVGQTCLSMLSESLKVFFRTTELKAGLDCEAECGETAFKKGFIRGYRICFGSHGVDWTGCPVDFAVLEQVVLARNDSQHVSRITETSARHSAATLRKHPSPLFVRDNEKSQLKDESGHWFIDPAVHVSRADLHLAICEVEKLAAWLEQ